MVFGLTQYVLGQEAPAAGVRSPARKDRGRRDARERQSAAAAASGLLRFTAVEWKRMGAIVIFFLFAVLFWGAYEQAGSTLNLFADRYTRLEVLGFAFPSSWFQSVQPVFVILLAPVFAWLWIRLGTREPSVPAKFAFGAALHGAGVPGARARRRDGPKRRRQSASAPGGWSCPTRVRARRAVPQPGRTERRDQARAGAHRRPDDGRLVPVERVRQQARRVGRELFGTMPLDTLFAIVAGVLLVSAMIMFTLVKPVRRLMGEAG